MLTIGQASFLRTNIHSFVGLALIAVVATWYGLQIWQAAGNGDPLAGAMASALYERQTIQALEAN